MQSCLLACISLGLGPAFPSRQFLAERLRCSLLWLGDSSQAPDWVRAQLVFQPAGSHP